MKPSSKKSASAKYDSAHMAALQGRAEELSERFKCEKRRPIVIEFAGLPKAGKTSTIGQVQSFLRRCGFRVEVAVERASICPIRDKKHSNFNVWTACTTLAKILEHTQSPGNPDDPEILILDRGLFDAVCWMAVAEKLARLRPSERRTIEAFLLSDEWRRRVSGVVLMTAKPDDALHREGGHLPVEGKFGSIMNHEVLKKFAQIIKSAAYRLQNQFDVLQVDTSSSAYSGNPQQVSRDVASAILDWVERELEERILCLPIEAVKKVFAGKTTVDDLAAAQLSLKFLNEGRWVPRAEAEADRGFVQAISVVIVRNKRGDVLKLRRKERNSKSVLHEKIVLWAGGHVREEDSHGGPALASCASREVREELRLFVEQKHLVQMGAIWAPLSEGTAKHIAMVYEWRAQSDDVGIALSNSEFFEKRGNSLSGSFVTVEQLIDDLNGRTLTEEWSAQIVRNFLRESRHKVGRELFD